MTRRDDFSRLLAGIGADLSGYAAVASLLDEQFQAIVAHDAPALQALGAKLIQRCAELDRRRAERIALVRRLGGGEDPGAVERVLGQLPPAARETTLDAWRALETRLRTCQQKNARNCQLLMGQHEQLAGLSGGDADTYAPA